MTTSLRWLIFTVAAVASAAFGFSWVFGRGRSLAMRAAGGLLLVVAAGWVAGPAGRAVAALVPTWTGQLTAWLQGRSPSEQFPAAGPAIVAVPTGQ